MNTRIACLLLILIAHASATAAPKFPLRLDAALVSTVGLARISALTWSHDGKTLASNGVETKVIKGTPTSVNQLILWDAENWAQEPKNRISVNNLGAVVEADFFDPNNSSRLAIYLNDLGRFSYGILNLNRPKDKPRIIGQELKLVHSPGRTGLRSDNWSRDGKKIAFNHLVGNTGSNYHISIVDAVSGKKLHTLNPHKALQTGRRDFGYVWDWSPGGKYLVTHTGSSLVVFDNKLEEELFRFDLLNFNSNRASSLGIQAVGWDPTGKEIAFSDGRKNMNFLDVSDLGKNEDQKGAPSRYKQVKPDRSFPMKDKDREGKGIELPGILAWGPQGRRIAVTFTKKERMLIGTKRGGPIVHIPVIHIYSKGGTLLHEFVVKNLFRHPKKTHTFDFRVASLEWSPDGFKIAAGLGDGTIRVFKTPK